MIASLRLPVLALALIMGAAPLCAQNAPAGGSDTQDSPLAAIQPVPAAETSAEASSDRRGSRLAGRSDAAWQAGRATPGGQHESVQDRHPEARRGT